MKFKFREFAEENVVMYFGKIRNWDICCISNKICLEWTSVNKTGRVARFLSK